MIKDKNGNIILNQTEKIEKLAVYIKNLFYNNRDDKSYLTTSQ